MKLCRRCGLEKPEGDFYADTTRKDGLYPNCRSCASEAKKASRSRRTPEQIANDRQTIKRWRIENPDRQRTIERRADFKRKYGITLDEYDSLLEEQDGVCAICSRAEPRRGYRLAVDHCHDSGQVRGLLCSHCNRAIGYLKDSADLVRRALNYLEAV